jgi:anti-sigma B factor antagonist
MDLQMTAYPRGRHLVITIGGELDIATAPALRSYLTRVLDQQASSDVILDVTDVEFIDARGLSALLAIKADVLRRGGSLWLSGSSRPLTRLLALTGLRKQFPSYPARQAAAAAGHSLAVTRSGVPAEHA